RLHLWSDGARMVAARPITGWGEDSTGLAFGHFLSQDYATYVTFDRIHSGPLDIAATQGVLGLVALAWVLVVLFRGVWRGRSEPGVAGLTAALAGYSVWVLFNFDWAPATGAFWLLAGTLWSACSPPYAVGRSPERRVGSRVWQPALATVLVVAATVFAVFPILADTWYLRGRADLSVQVDPLQAQYHWSLGEGLIAKREQARGVAELRRAADLGETEPSLYVELGDRELEIGDRDAVRRAYQRALQIDPYYSSEMWSRPSMPGMICRKAPYFLVLVTWPSTIEPTGIDWTRRSHGSCCSCRSDSEIRVCSGSSLITLTVTSSPSWSTSVTLETRSHDSSEMWI